MAGTLEGARGGGKPNGRPNRGGGHSAALAGLVDPAPPRRQLASARAAESRALREAPCS
ncbi:hypothetical protein BV133_1614 [Blastochloris viridis]|uniref:Uncharacterized protein n=1 Tax=Blastochloris viridis TaxID=1079 RepID=A0A182D2L7_BLAVI|nr:hypothetical protein BV133_1614 [Blastochloris viridis]